MVAVVSSDAWSSALGVVIAKPWRICRRYSSHARSGSGGRTPAAAKAVEVVRKQRTLVSATVVDVQRTDDAVGDVVRPGTPHGALPVEQARGAVGLEVHVPGMRVAVDQRLGLSVIGCPETLKRRLDGVPVT
jgi:hypothetical protein